MKTLIHATAGTLAMLCILSFWISTVVSELFLSPEAVIAVKQAILYGLWILIPALAITGGSGFSLAGNRTARLVKGKKKRMPFIALNGLLILLPSAVYLSVKATAGEFDTAFYSVQVLELLAGIVQLLLMGRNFSDGLRLTARLRHTVVTERSGP